MQLVLITGGAGFIGSHTADRLLAGGVRVRVLDNLSSGRVSHLDAAAVADGRLAFTRADVRDEGAVQHAAQGCDAVLHLAAQVSVQKSVADPRASAANNIEGFLTVIDAVRKLGIPRLVYASSAAVFGTRAPLPVSEASDLFPVSPYGLEKLVNEQYAALFQSLYGVSSLGMRYFNVYGPLQDAGSPYAGVISKFASGLASGQTLQVNGDGSQTRDFVYVGDVAEANVRALRAQVGGVMNLGTGASVSLLHLVRELGQAFGSAVEVRHAPGVAGEIAHSSTRVDRAREHLGWQARTSLATGLQELVASLRAPARLTDPDTPGALIAQKPSGPLDHAQNVSPR